MKTLRKIGFFTAFVLPALVMIGFYAGGGWNFLALAFVFGFITVIDHFTGIDKENIEETEAKVVGDEFYYRFVTYIWTFVQVAFVVWGAFAVTTGRLTTTLEWVGFVIGFSLVTGGIGITVAHELGHKKSKL
ncbi:MAG: alkane 1-monooxygenase, partial [Cytophagales bacterium]|nr:alkane 1-monooxygenase [Cytophagales bacterium]